MAPTGTQRIGGWIEQSAQATSSVFKALAGPGKVESRLIKALGLLNDKAVARRLNKKDESPLKVLSSLIQDHLQKGGSISVPALVELAEAKLFVQEPLFGYAWLLPIQNVHWLKTPANRRTGKQKEWLNQKLKHAQRNLPLFLRVLVGEPASYAATGMQRVHEMIRSEIRPHDDADGRRQVSTTFKGLQETFLGGRAALEAFVTRVPRSDVALFQQELVPRLLTPEAGVRTQDLATVFADIVALLSILFAKTGSKNGVIRAVKTVVRRHWDESNLEIRNTLKGFRVPPEEKFAADRAAMEQRRFAARHPIRVEHDHILQLIDDHLDSDDWFKQAIAIMLNTGARLLECLVFSDFDVLDERARPLSAVRSRCVDKLQSAGGAPVSGLDFSEDFGLGS